MVALTDQVMAALTDATSPLSTNQVAQAVGRNPWDPKPWRALDWLERNGRVDRIQQSYGRDVFWQRTPATEDDLRNASLLGGYEVTPIDLEANDG